MKCPQCGKEVPDNSNFCPTCGFNFSTMPRENVDDPAHEVNNLSTTNGTPASVDPSYRNEPGFKKKLMIMNICGAVSFVLSGLALFASIMLKFGENVTPGATALYVVLLIVGLLAGLIISFVVLIPMGKKCFPDGKAKGFLENFPGVWLGFSVAFIAVALVFQGFRLIIT